MSTNAVKAQRSRTAAKWLMIGSFSYAACGTWHLLTGQTMTAFGQGLISITAGILSVLALLAADGWQDRANDEAQP